MDGHYFITVDNGLMRVSTFGPKPEAIYEITINNRLTTVEICSVDIFVPVAAHLTKGGLPEPSAEKSQYK